MCFWSVILQLFQEFTACLLQEGCASFSATTGTSCLSFLSSYSQDGMVSRNTALVKKPRSCPLWFVHRAFLCLCALCFPSCCRQHCRISTPDYLPQELSRSWWQLSSCPSCVAAKNGLDRGGLGLEWCELFAWCFLNLTHKVPGAKLR